MGAPEVAVALRVLGLTATPCSCNDGSLVRGSQKRDKVLI